MKKISVVVPCYNEEEVLNIFYDEICRVSKQMSEYDFQFVFVDDGSKDRTLEIMKGLAEKDERVLYISFSRNFGKESAMFAGLSNADGDYVAKKIMDNERLAHNMVLTGTPAYIINGRVIRGAPTSMYQLEKLISGSY